MARVARYLALESAGQCGPCLNGLPRIATALAGLAGIRPDGCVIADVERWAGLAEGRGACHHPDGAVRFVCSGLRVFAAEIRSHQQGACTAAGGRAFLPVPAGPGSENDWRMP
jgi:NADH:ubiquinone oxidoreductase subunit F (NADH-binding)